MTSFLIPEKEACCNIKLALDNVKTFHRDLIIYYHSGFGSSYVIKDDNFTDILWNNL